MRFQTYLLVALLTLSGIARGQAPDPVRADLDKAEAAWKEARASAAAELSKAIDEQIKLLAAKNDLEAVKTLSQQRDTFALASIPPSHISISGPVTRYDAAAKQADAVLFAAYDKAIAEYNAQKKFTEALAIRQARRQLAEGAVAQGPVTSPEAIGALLLQAKAQHKQAISDAKATLLAAIDARVTAATNAGDLKTVTAMRDVRATVNTDGAVPDTVKDATIIAARNRFNSATLAANTRLTAAYEAAVRDYTKAKALNEAMATQSELDASGLKGKVTQQAAPPPVKFEPITKLAKILPPQVSATGTYTPEREGGITLGRDCKIRSKINDFLLRDKNFIFDVWVKIENKSGGSFVGLGDGSPERSIGVMLRGPDDQNRDARLCSGDQWGDVFADVREPGTYILRVERHGGPVTVSVGIENEGEIEIFGSRTVQNPTAFNKNIDTKITYVFFTGGGLFKQYRLTILPPTAPPTPGAKLAPITLGRELPPELMAESSFSAVASGGVIPTARGKPIETRAADFLEKDFVFDVWVRIEAKGAWAWIGIGDGDKRNSLGVAIRPPDDQNKGIALTHGDEWGDKFGKMTEPGEYVVRIEKKGQTMTFSVGTEENGVFTPDCSKSVADPQKLMPRLSPRSAHLCFGGSVLYRQYRLLVGNDVELLDSMAKPAGGVKPGAAAPADPVVPLASAGGPATPTIPQATANVPPTATTPPATTTPPQTTASAPASPQTPAVVGVIPRQIPADNLIAVGRLESRRKPALAATGSFVPFTAPRYDNLFHGANGLVLSPGASWSQTGTVWICNKFTPRPMGITFIHPLGEGHVQVTIGSKMVRYRIDGKWAKQGWTELPQVAGFQGFPLPESAATPLRSEMTADGIYRLYVNGTLAVNVRLSSGKPVAFTDGFKGDGLPDQLGKGQAAVIIDNSNRATSIADELSFYPAK